MTERQIAVCMSNVCSPGPNKFWQNYSKRDRCPVRYGHTNSIRFPGPIARCEYQRSGPPHKAPNISGKRFFGSAVI